MAFQRWCEMVGLDIKPHQVEGFDWCMRREQDKTMPGGIVCDEMGLGKTILMVACIELGVQNKPTLVVVPPSLLQQWKEVFEKFVLDDSIFVYHGYAAKNITLSELKSKRIVLTTYGMIAHRKSPEYKSMLWGIHWARIICDEAHHARNPKTNICKGLMKIVIRTKIKWFVTGTPIQNKLCDIRVLFTLMGNYIRGEEHMKLSMKKYVLRRTKKSVGIKIPERKSKTIIVGWESKMEENLAASIHAALPVFGVSVDRSNVNEIMDYLDYESALPLFVRSRQVCINPKLLEKCVHSMQEGGIIPANFRMTRVPTMSKISAIVRKVKSQPKELKKLIFCYYRGEIDELRRRLENEGYNVGVMDGRSKKRERLAACDPESEHDVLIAQIQSASEGLNLQHLSQVYFTSPHWNPAVEEQAIARAHRIGQKKSVQTFHFEMAPFENGGKSLDTFCIEVQQRKRELMKLLDN
jgi:SNF2 family DNA or RNA helicase